MKVHIPIGHNLKYHDILTWYTDPFDKLQYPIVYTCSFSIPWEVLKGSFSPLNCQKSITSPCPQTTYGVGGCNTTKVLKKIKYNIANLHADNTNVDAC